MPRKRYVYTQGGQPIRDEQGNLAPIEVLDDWSNAPPGGLHRSEEEVYGHIQATDGTDLSTRKRHRDYMKRNNLTIADDFKSDWAKAAEQRERVGRGDFDHEGRRQDIARAMESTRRNKR